MRMEALSKSFISRYHDYMPLWARDSDSSQTLAQRRRRMCTIGVATLLVILLVPVFLLMFGGESKDSQVVQAGGSSWEKPAGLTVVALVFYGRRQNVQILERYLRVS